MILRNFIVLVAVLLGLILIIWKIPAPYQHAAAGLGILLFTGVYAWLTRSRGLY